MKIKNNQIIFAITSAMCLLPVLLSLMLYNDLPEQIAVHWNSAGVADIFLPKALAAFGLPKCRQNYTIGIKLPWTLSDADNWNKTHRIVGYLWMIGGLIVLIAAFLSIRQTVFGVSVLVLVVIFLVAAPITYSYSLYKKTISGKSER